MTAKICATWVFPPVQAPARQVQRRGGVQRRPVMPVVGSNEELELFERLCNHTNVDEDFFLSLVALNFASVVQFASLHSGLCTQNPSDEALNVVAAMVLTHHGVSCTGIDVARLRQLAMPCATALPAAQARSALSLGAVPAATVVTGYTPAS